MKLYFLFLLSCIYLFANELQEVINKAPAYATIKLKNGIYKGNINIDKPLTIEGIGDNVTIVGDSIKSVITIQSSDVTLKNLFIKKSGMNMQSIDSGISMRKVHNCKISHCHIYDVLYGIDMDMVIDSNITHNYITTKKNTIPLRANGLKLYYSHNNNIEYNIIKNVKDVTLDYSNYNLFKNNTFIGNRFATYISLSHNNKFYNNTYKYNSVSIMFMGAKNTKVIGNKILSSNGAAGIGVVISGVSNLHFEKNIISYNTQGIYIDSKKTEKGMQRYIINNEISFNKEAIHFHQAIKNNTITYNKIFGNIDDVVKDVRGISSPTNIIEYNYWDRYAGFDRDGDNIGDTPYKIYQYTDQLWQYHHKIKFFYATPIMSLMNFLAKIAPFIEPTILLEDKKPIVSVSL